MNFKKNKKGADKLISVYWFVILTLIAGGIVMMANSYYSSPYDVREIEANALGGKVANCIYPAGEANPNFISPSGVVKQEFLDNFETHCNLNIKPEGEFTKSQYYIKLLMYQSEKKKNEILEFEAGNLNFAVDCNLKEKNKNVATCVDNEFWIKMPNGKLNMVVIRTGIGKVDQNA